jgi:hypothetical protein
MPGEAHTVVDGLCVRSISRALSRWRIASDTTLTWGVGVVPHRFRVGCQRWQSSNLRNSDTVTIYRDILIEATRGRYKEATHCITTTKDTATGHRGNSVSGQALLARVEALSAPSSRHGGDRSALGVSDEDVDRGAELAGATFAPRFWRCSRNVPCTATRSFKNLRNGRTAFGR